MPVYIWSKTAGNNATADSVINWAEGQAPSTVNDSARAMMAETAKWRDDIAGSITTGGSATAYTLTSNQVFDTLAHMSGQLIAFIPHATNTSDTQTTLNVDSLGAKPIRFAPSVEIQSGHLVLGSPYLCSYNNADGAFYLIGRENAPSAANKFQVDLNGVNQVLTPSTNAKVLFSRKNIDPDGVFDAVTNNRFTPNKPGYYWLSLQLTFTGDGGNRAAIYKNGVVMSSGTFLSSLTGVFLTSTAQFLVKTTNGTDYFEAFALADASATNVIGDTSSSFFMGWRISP